MIKVRLSFNTTQLSLIQYYLNNPPINKELKKIDYRKINSIGYFSCKKAKKLQELPTYLKSFYSAIYRIPRIALLFFEILVAHKME